jgi:hypothetical protein
VVGYEISRRYRKRFGSGQDELDCYSWLRLLKRQYFELKVLAFLLVFFVRRTHVVLVAEEES